MRYGHMEKKRIKSQKGKERKKKKENGRESEKRKREKGCNTPKYTLAVFGLV